MQQEEVVPQEVIVSGCLENSTICSHEKGLHIFVELNESHENGKLKSLDEKTSKMIEKKHSERLREIRFYQKGSFNPLTPKSPKIAKICLPLTSNLGVTVTCKR